MGEEWKEVIRITSVRHCKIYEVSNLGNVRARNPRHLANTSKGEYRYLIPQRGGSNKQYLKIQLGRAIGYKYIHHLVLEAFIGKCPEGHNANHKDHNNVITNLEWVTYSKNSQEMQNFYGGVNQYTKHKRRED